MQGAAASVVNASSANTTDVEEDDNGTEMFYYNPHRMSDVLYSDTESRLLNFADLKYAEYLYRRQSSTLDNREPMTPVIRDYTGEHFNIFVNHPERILTDDFVYTMNNVHADETVAIRQEIAAQIHLEQLYVASGLAGNFTRKVLVKGKELGGQGGLTSDEADEWLYYSKQGRVNEFESMNPLSMWVLIVQCVLRQNMVVVLGAIILFLMLEEWLSFFILCVIVFFVITLRLWNERSLQFNTVLSTLDRHTAICATVKRDNIWKIVESSQLVPGDLILLEGPGSIVPADCRINPIASHTGGLSAQTEDHQLEIRMDQSVLTGYSPSIVSVYPGDSIKMLSRVVMGENIQCTVEYTSYDTYLGKMIQVVRRSCGILQLATSHATKFDVLTGTVARKILILIVVVGVLVIVYDGSTEAAAAVSSGFNLGVSQLFMIYFMMASAVLSLLLLCWLVLIMGGHEFHTNYRVQVHRLSSILDLACMNILCVDTAMLSHTVVANRSNGIADVNISQPVYQCQLEVKVDERQEQEQLWYEDGTAVDMASERLHTISSVYIQDCNIQDLFEYAIMATKWPDIFHDPTLFDTPEIELQHDDFAQYIITNNHANPNYELQHTDNSHDFAMTDSIDYSLLTKVSDWPGIIKTYQQIHYDITSYNATSTDSMCVNNDIFNSQSTGGNPHCIQTMSTVVNRETGESFRIIKGAPHIILQMVLNSYKPSNGSSSSGAQYTDQVEKSEFPSSDADEMMKQKIHEYDDNDLVDQSPYDNQFILEFEKDIVRFVQHGYRVIAVAKSTLPTVKRSKGKKHRSGHKQHGQHHGHDHSHMDSKSKSKRKKSGIFIDDEGNVIRSQPRGSRRGHSMKEDVYDSDGNKVEQPDDEEEQNDMFESAWDSDSQYDSDAQSVYSENHEGEEEDRLSSWDENSDSDESDCEYTDEDENPGLGAEAHPSPWELVGLLTFIVSSNSDDNANIADGDDTDPNHDHANSIKEQHLEEDRMRDTVMKDCIYDMNQSCGVCVKVVSSDNWWTMKDQLTGKKADEFTDNVAVSSAGHAHSRLGLSEIVQSPFTVNLPSLEELNNNHIPADLAAQHGDCIVGSDAFAEIYPQHKYLIAECLKQRKYDVGVFGQSPADIGAMATASVSFALNKADSRAETTLVQAVADILLPVVAIATDRSNSLNHQDVPELCTTTGFVLMPKCIMLARVILQRIYVVVQHKIVNLLYLLFAQSLIVAALSVQSVRDESIQALHNDSSTSHIVLIPVSLIMITMLLADLLCYYTVTFANHTNSTANDHEHDDYEFGLKSQRLDSIHVTATNTVVTDSYERETDELLFQSRFSRLSHATTANLGDNVSVGASRHPENIQHVGSNKLIIGLMMAWVSGCCTFIFVYFITRAAYSDTASNGVNVNVVSALNTHPEQHGFGTQLLHTCHSLLQHNGHVSAVVGFHLFLIQMGMFLSVNNGKESAWRRAGWWLLASEEVVNKNMINIATTEWIVLIVYYCLLPGSFAVVGNGLDYSTSVNGSHTLTTSFGTYLLSCIGGMILICIYTGLQFLLIDGVKLWMIYQLRKHNSWSHICDTNLMTYSASTLAFLSRQKDSLLIGEQTYINNTEPLPEEEEEEDAMAVMAMDEYGYPYAQGHGHSLAGHSPSYYDYDGYEKKKQYDYTVTTDAYGNQIDEYGNVIIADYDEGGDYMDDYDDEGQKQEQGQGQEVMYDEYGNVIMYEYDDQDQDQEQGQEYVDYEYEGEGEGLEWTDELALVADDGQDQDYGELNQDQELMEGEGVDADMYKQQSFPYHDEPGQLYSDQQDSDQQEGEYHEYVEDESDQQRFDSTEESEQHFPDRYDEEEEDEP